MDNLCEYCDSEEACKKAETCLLFTPEEAKDTDEEATDDTI